MRNAGLPKCAYLKCCCADTSEYQASEKGNLNPLSANPTKWSNTLKQFAGKFPTNCLSVFDHFVTLAYNVNGVI